MKRRHFLRGMATATATASLFSNNPMSLSFRKAMAAEGKTLVVVFQRGGCDGLNTVIPYNEPNYYRIRPTIAIPAIRFSVIRFSVVGFRFGVFSGFFGL